MLSLGTALPHLLRTVGAALDWHGIVWLASGCAVLGGISAAWVGDDPHHPVAARMTGAACSGLFARSTFGPPHSATPATCGSSTRSGRIALAPQPYPVDVRTDAADVVSVYRSRGGGLRGWRAGQPPRRQRRGAASALATSGLICLVYPWLGGLSMWGFASLMTLWGLAVVADSPQFSALAATAVVPDTLGSALGVMNSAGFLISIAAIELTTGLWQALGPAVIWLLAPGPLLGLWRLRRELSGANRRPEANEMNR